MLVTTHLLSYNDSWLINDNWTYSYLNGENNRFDIEGDYIEGDKESQERFPSHTHSDLPNTFVPSPPLQDEPQNRKYQLLS